MSSNPPFCLQASHHQEITDLRTRLHQFNNRQETLDTRITNLDVRFMNTVDVTVVVTVLANFQTQIVLYL